MITNAPHIEELNERAILAGVHSRVFTAQEDATWETLDELEELLKTAGGVCTAKGVSLPPASFSWQTPLSWRAGVGCPLCGEVGWGGPEGSRQSLERSLARAALMGAYL